MINSITIQNLQSHKDTHLDFSPGVNVIIGQSDSGKTAIIRALKWLVWNKLAGDAIRSHWGGDTKVRLVLDNAMIERIRTDKENTYFLDGDEFEAIKFKAVRMKVPEEIQQALNINNMNLQQQLDSPFLLMDSPGEVAQHFNKVAQLDVIDRGLSNVQKWIRQADQDIKSKKAQIEKAQRELTEYDYLEQMEKDVISLETTEQEKNNTTQTITKLQELIEQVNVLDIEMEKAKKILIIENSVIKALQKTEQLISLQTEIEIITNTITEIEIIDKQLKENQVLLVMEKAIQNLITLQNERGDIIIQIKALKLLLTDINTITYEMGSVEEEIIKLQKQMPEICPCCDQKIKKENK